MLKIIDKIILIFTIPMLVGLVGAYSARYIDPNTWVIPSLLGLAYPFLLISNILFLLYWITRWHKMALVVLAILLLGIPVFMSYYGTNSRSGENEPSDLSILSYNVRYFDRYAWTKNKNTRYKLLDYLNRFKGDVACLQEFPVGDNPLKVEIIHSLSSYKYHYINGNMALFSRKPIIRAQQIPFDKNYTSSCIYCDIAGKKDTVRIYSVHLESYKLGNKERQFVKEITGGSGNDISKGIKNILSRISKANQNRAVQAEQIKRHSLDSPHPVIICGDFNDTPLSYTYRELDNGLKDCFIEKGRGLGNTYIGEFPSFRIDYILHSPEYKAVGYSRGSVSLSDHYPITARLKKQ